MQGKSAEYVRIVAASTLPQRAGISWITVHHGLAKAASDDELGRKLDYLGLSAKKRVSAKRVRKPKP